MTYIEYLDLPRIPTHLLESLDDLITKPLFSNPYGTKSDISYGVGTRLPHNTDPKQHYTFTRRNTSPELHAWLQTIFKFSEPFISHYQIINDPINLHRDPGRKVAFNYIIESGGENVSTEIYKYKHPDLTLLQSEVIPLFTWHKLNVGELHCVKNIDPTKTRLAISVTGSSTRLFSDPNPI
jgi:hypothetical protein